MQQNEKLKKELQALRKENARLKAELSDNSKKNQKLLNDDLRLKEAQLRDAYALANISAWSYDIVTNILTPSEQLTKIWDPPKENVREAFLARMHPDDRDKLLPVIENLEKYDSYDYQYRIVGDNGNMYYFYCRGTIKRDEHGKAVKVLGLNWDITEKKLHEKQTLQTENNLRFFFEKIGLGVWEYTVNAGGVYFTEAIRRFTGMKHKNEIVTKEDFLAKVHFQDAERVKIEFEKVLAGENPIYDCMYRILRKNDQYVWVLSRGVPIFDNKAQVYKVIGSMEELSQSKRYNIIKERLDFMQSIADALPVPVYYKDMAGRYIGYNEAFKEFMKDSANEDNAIGSTMRDSYFEHDEKVVLQLENDEKAFFADPDKKFEKTYTFTGVCT